MEIKSRAVMSGFVSILRGMLKKDIINAEDMSFTEEQIWKTEIQTGDKVLPEL